MSMGDNIAYLRDPDGRAIKADLERAETSRQTWIDAMVSAATRIAAKRALLVNDQEFGDWWDAQEFGLNRNDRAALVMGGSAPDVMRALYAETDRRSLKVISENSSRFHRPVKPPRRKPTVEKKPKPAAEPKVQKSLDPEVERPKEKRAREIVRGLMDAGVTLPGSHDLEKQYADDPDGPSHNAFDLARAVERALDAERAEQQANPIIEPGTLSLSAQKKLEIAARRLDKHAHRTLASWRAQLDQQVNERVQANTAKQLDYLREQQAKAEAAQVEYNELRNNFKPIFTIGDWRVLVKAVHGNEEARNEASDLLTTNKFKLTGER